jgi:hypothetical protein
MKLSRLSGAILTLCAVTAITLPAQAVEVPELCCTARCENSQGSGCYGARGSGRGLLPVDGRRVKSQDEDSDMGGHEGVPPNSVGSGTRARSCQMPGTLPEPGLGKCRLGSGSGNLKHRGSGRGLPKDPTETGKDANKDSKIWVICTATDGETSCGDVRFFYAEAQETVDSWIAAGLATAETAWVQASY